MEYNTNDKKNNLGTLFNSLEDMSLEKINEFSKSNKKLNSNIITNHEVKLNIFSSLKFNDIKKLNTLSTEFKLLSDTVTNNKNNHNDNKDLIWTVPEGTSEDEAIEFLKRNPNVTEINNFDKIELKSKRTRFDFYMRAFKECGHFKNSIKHLNSLEYGMSLEQMQQLPELKHLKYINFCSCKNLADKSFVDILNKLPHIEYIKCEAKSISLENLEGLRNSKHLKEINFRGCNNITNKGLIEFLNKFPNIEEINLYKCDNIFPSIESRHSGKEAIAKLKQFLEQKISMKQKFEKIYADILNSVSTKKELVAFKQFLKQKINVESFTEQKCGNFTNKESERKNQNRSKGI